MRLRLFGHHLHVSIAVLAAIEGVAFFIVLLLAARLRLQSDLAEIEADVGPLWPRALIFSAVMLTSLFALGLYSAR